jgi:hypothetical protein
VITGMVGGQYTGISDLVVDIEVSQGWLTSPRDDLVFPVDSMTYGGRASYTTSRERLVFTAVGMVFGYAAQYGGLARADATYEIADGWHASLGAITYRPGSETGPLVGLDTHDRVFMQVRYDF